MPRTALPRRAPRRPLRLAGAILAPALALMIGLPAAAEPGSLDLAVRIPDRPQTQERLSLEALAALPQREIRAVTPWTEGVTTFEGVPFETLAARMNVAQGPAAITALNAYQITIDVAQVIADGGVLAMKMNGAPMSVRDKGPIWLVFPSQDRPELAATDNTWVWIWQVDAIEFGPR